MATGQWEKTFDEVTLPLGDGPSILRGEDLELPSPVFVHQMFAKAVTEKPVQAAKTELIWQDELMPYAEVKRRVDVIASALSQALNASCKPFDPDDELHTIVLDIVPKADLIILTYAAWQLGCSVSIVERRLPAGRLQKVYDVVKPLLVVREEGERQNFWKEVTSSPHVTLQELFAGVESSEEVKTPKQIFHLELDSVAMIQQTSGSTGVPKIIGTTHRNLTNRCVWQWRTYPYEEGEVCCFKTPVSFIDTPCEIVVPVTSLTFLAIAPVGIQQYIPDFIAFLKKHKIRRAVIVTSILKAMIQECARSHEMLEDLTLIDTGGEDLPVDLHEEFYRLFGTSKVLYNAYGSTELTADALWYKMLPDEAINLKVGSPIGAPVLNTRAYILNEFNQIVDEGVPGQLAMSGHIVATVIYPKSEGRSVKNPEGDIRHHETLYLTGDLCRIKDGNVYFMGRIDNQIKTSGTRVNLDEIEQTLARLEWIQQVVVLAIGKRNRLIAFVRSSRTAEDVFQYAKENLPYYMVPQVEVLDEFPIMPFSGKIHRPELRKRGDDYFQSLTAKLTSPATDVDTTSSETLKTLSEAVQVVADLPGPPNPQASFFDLGFDSNMLTQLLLQLEKQDIVISFIQLLEAPTVIDLCNAINGRCKEKKSTSFVDGIKLILLRDYPNRQAAIDLLNDGSINRNPPKVWLENSTHEAAMVTTMSRLELVDNDDNNLSYVAVDKDGNLLGFEMVFEHKDYQKKITFHENHRPFVMLMHEMESPIFKELEAQGLNFLDDVMSSVSEKLSAAEQLMVMDYLHSNVEKIARERGYDAIYSCNTNPVTIATAERQGFTMKASRKIKNYEFRGRKYYTADYIPDDYFIAGFVKMLK